MGNWRQTIFTPVGGSSTTEVRQHNGLNQITSIKDGTSPKVPITYDGTIAHSNGNLRNDGTLSYTWDALNRLVQVNLVSGDAVIANYYYDALNRRIRKVVSNGGLPGNVPDATTDCIYSGWRCVEDRNPVAEGGDTPIAQYLWGIYLDELLQMTTYAAAGSQPLAAGMYYPLQDLLYRSTALTDSSANIVEVYDTDAYGNTLIFSVADGTGNWWSDSAVQADYPACAFIFTGQRLDAETGLFYDKNRYYSMASGRFLSKDPIGYRGKDPNLYRYVVNSPISHVDPLGMKIWCCGGESLTAVRMLGIGTAWTAYQLAQEAIQEAKRVAPSLPGGIGGLHNGAADAFRHCFWSCRMAEELGKVDALIAGAIHEDCDTDQPAGEAAMDTENNKTGVILSRGHNCSNACAKAGQDGTLQTSPGGTTPGYLAY